MRFLCISDIHGHYAALEAVLTTGRAHGFDQLIVCGDLLFPGPDPLKVWKTLLENKALCVLGLADRALAMVDPAKLSATTERERARIERLRQVHAELGDLIIAHLGKLPPVARLPVESGDELVIVHGSPADPSEPFTHDMSDDEIWALVGDDPGDVIVCGGSHVPFERHLSDVRIVNVGSVGEAPSGTHADATLIETTPFGIDVRQLTIDL
jgi:predicted phosphodiesterase